MPPNEDKKEKAVGALVDPNGEKTPVIAPVHTKEEAQKAPEKKPDEKQAKPPVKDEAKTPRISLPLPMEELLGTPQEQTVRNWNKQARDGIIFQCKEGGCYYPLVPLRDANNQPVVFNTKYKSKNGKELVKTEFVLTCTYHPEHGSTITLPSNLVVLKDGQRISSVVGFRMGAPAKDGDDLSNMT